MAVSSFSTDRSSKTRASLLEALPKNARSLASGLSNDDSEVLLYLVFFGCHIHQLSGSFSPTAKSIWKPWKNGTSSRSSDGGRKQHTSSSPASSSSSSRSSNGGWKRLSDHHPSFSCYCFFCYASFWSRWSASSNRDLICQILELVESQEDGVGTGKSKKKKKQEKKIASAGGKRGADNGKVPAISIYAVDDTPSARVSEVGAQSKQAMKGASDAIPQASSATDEAYRKTLDSFKKSLDASTTTMEALNETRGAPEKTRDASRKTMEAPKKTMEAPKKPVDASKKKINGDSQTDTDEKQLACLETLDEPKNSMVSVYGSPVNSEAGNEQFKASSSVHCFSSRSFEEVRNELFLKASSTVLAIDSRSLEAVNQISMKSSSSILIFDSRSSEDRTACHFETCKDNNELDGDSAVQASLALSSGKVSPKLHLQQRPGKRKSNQIIPVDCDNSLLMSDDDQGLDCSADAADSYVPARLAESNLSSRGFFARVFPDALGGVASRLWDMVSLRTKSRTVEYN